MEGRLHSVSLLPLEIISRRGYIEIAKGTATMDYGNLQEKYGGRHVARRGEEVIASSEDLARLLSELKKKGLMSEEVVVEYVRPKGTVYAL